MEPPPALQDKAKKIRQKEFEFIGRNITPIDRMENRWDKNQTGILVLEVTQGGWASIAGLRVEDVIQSVNGQAVRDVAAISEVLKGIMKNRPKIIKVFVMRDAQTHFIFIEPDWSKIVQGS